MFLFQELLFCETCDTVFCTLCTGGTHKPGLSTNSPTHSGGTDSGNNSPTHQNASSTADHTVIPFSIAIKRMSEILIYKANECTSKLDEATEIVNAEIHRLVFLNCKKLCKNWAKFGQNCEKKLGKNCA